MKNINGKFIVIEGMDGAGTTTQADLLVKFLIASNIKAHKTQEPSNGPIGMLLRSILCKRVVGPVVNGVQQPVENATIALLFAGDRLDHLASEVLPLLKDDVCVVSDRYTHSSLVYQSVVNTPEWLLRINVCAREPDVCYILDLPVSDAAARRKDRLSNEIYENDSFQTRVAEGYRKVNRYFSHDIVMIDSSKDVQSVHISIVEDLMNRFPLVKAPVQNT